jgi:hypothetical protein
MTMTTLGRINVATPGTPVPLATDPSITASKLFVQAVPGLTGKTYLGARTMSKTTLAGVARVLSTGDNFFLESQDGADSIRLKDYAVDADVAAEGLLVSYWTE